GATCARVLATLAYEPRRREGAMFSRRCASATDKRSRLCSRPLATDAPSRIIQMRSNTARDDHRHTNSGRCRNVSTHIVLSLLLLSRDAVWFLCAHIHHGGA